ncbi:MAG: SCO family protein [Anaerolineales bacterium]
MERKSLWVIGILLSVALVAVGLTYYFQMHSRAFKGEVIDPPVIAPDIALTSQGDSTVRLSNFRGKVVLVFFGYTNCPDECPATMAILRQVRTDLGAAASEIQVLFVTTDPVRDSPAQLAKFMARFDPTFIGLTGSTSDLAGVYANYGVTVLDNGQTHSTRVYVVDRNGMLGLTLPTGMTPADIEHDLRLVLKGK